MEVFEAVLFDMDGVVIDTQRSVTAFWLACAAEQGITLTAGDFEDHIFGVPVSHTLRVLFPGLAPDAAFRKRVHDYERGLTYSAVAGLTEFLSFLKGVGIPTALVTSGEEWKVEEMTRQLGIAGVFNSIVTATDVRWGKPHPECYTLAARQLDVPSSRCLVFEDSLSGVKAAVAAGALCIGVQSGRLAQRLLDSGAWGVVADFTFLQRTRTREHRTSAPQWTVHLRDDYCLSCARPADGPPAPWTGHSA